MEDVTQLPFFRVFSPDAVAPLISATRWHRYESGQTVLDAGDEAADVFIVAAGTLRVITRSTGGDEIILNEIGPGALFGEIAAIDGAMRSAGIVSLTQSAVCAIAAKPFMEFVLGTREASLQLMRSLAALVRAKDARLLELTVLPTRPRLIALLLRLARARDAGGLIVSPPRPHHELAARIGTRREVVSRIISALQREGLAERSRGGLILPRPKTLQEELDNAWTNPPLR